MKELFKKILSFLLAVLLAGSMLPLTALAEDAAAESASEDDEPRDPNETTATHANKTTTTAIGTIFFFMT